MVIAPRGRSLDGLALTHLLDDPMFVALPTTHRLAGRSVLRLADLAGERWIAGSSRPEETLLGAGFGPPIEIIAREWVAKQGLVAAGLGVTLIPSLAAGSVRPDIVLAALHPEDAPVRAIYAATVREHTPPPAVRAFVDALHTAATTLQSELPGPSAY